MADAKQQARLRAQKLRATIAQMRYKYHVLNDPTVTDTVYSSLMDELRKLERAYPDIVTAVSPTQRVGGVVARSFKKIRHAVAQWSFDDAFTQEDIAAFDERVRKLIREKTGQPTAPTYVSELKIDGIHLVLTYRDGSLITAATRGDGTVGEDVTENARTIQSIPLQLSVSFSGVVEGEVWMPTRVFTSLNAQRTAAGEPLFANPRNAAAGAMRQLDSALTASRQLEIFVYDISKIDGGITEPHTQHEELELLKKMGFQVNGDWKRCRSVADIMRMWEVWRGRDNTTHAYWVDGLVIKLDDRELQRALGYTGKAPRWGIAFKFPAEQATTVLERVVWQVGRTHVITPVAHVRPVSVAGTTVSHATLHNPDEIERLGVRVGDTVIIEKAGDIIPKISSVITTLRTGQEQRIVIPRRCPVCNSPTQRTDGVVALRCTNRSCEGSQRERIIHFVSKGGFDISGLGEKIVQQLIDEGLVSRAADIFSLTYEDLVGLDRFADVSAKKLVESIHAAKVISLEKFIFSLGIEHVGEEIATRLAQHFKTCDRFERATADELTTVSGVGDVVAASVAAYLADQQHQAQFAALHDAGVHVKDAQAHASGPLSGRVFVFTGTLDALSRTEAAQRVRARGATVADSITANVTDVVAGTKPGSKLSQARGRGIRVLTEEEFLRIIQP